MDIKDTNVGSYQCQGPLNSLHSLTAYTLSEDGSFLNWILRTLPNLPLPIWSIPTNSLSKRPSLSFTNWSDKTRSRCEAELGTWCHTSVGKFNVITELFDEDQESGFSEGMWSWVITVVDICAGTCRRTGQSKLDCMHVKNQLVDLSKLRRLHCCFTA